MSKWSAGDGRVKRVIQKYSKGRQNVSLVQRRQGRCASGHNGWAVLHWKCVSASWMGMIGWHQKKDGNRGEWWSSVNVKNVGIIGNTFPFFFAGWHGPPSYVVTVTATLSHERGGSSRGVVSC